MAAFRFYSHERTYSRADRADSASILDIQVTSAYESGSASEAGAQAQLQAQARQALRQQQRNDMVTPPDAAANFSPAVGTLGTWTTSL